MRELDFDKEPHIMLEYVVARVYEAESGDSQAINYLDWLWSEDEELLREAYRIWEEEQGA